MRKSPTRYTAGSGATQELLNDIDRPRSGGDTDSLQPPAHAVFQAFQTQSEQRAALAFGKGMDFVDDNGLGVEAGLPPSRFERTELKCSVTEVPIILP